MSYDDLEVIHEIPPIYETLRKKFGVSWAKGVIITYGEKVYCNFDLPMDKKVHEKTHIDQQMEMGPHVWWDRYLADPAFRLSQEIEAYRNEYKYVKKTVKDRNRCYKLLHLICTDLSSSMYGNIITYGDAMKLFS